MERRVFTRALVVLALGAALPAAASPIFFATEDDVLFRIQNGVTERFFLDDYITALDFDDAGVLWGVGVDKDNNGKHELYRVDDPFGNPSLTLVAETLTRSTTSIVWQGDVLYGIQGGDFNPPQTLVTIDPVSGAATPVGRTGNTGINPEQVGGITIKNGQMWALNNRLPGELYTIDWTLANGPDPTATFMRQTKPLLTFLVTNGLDIDPETGQMWAMIRKGNLIGSDIGIYLMDETTGQLTLAYDLSDLTWKRGASGLAVIPEAGTAMLLAAGLLGLRRRGRG